MVFRSVFVASFLVRNLLADNTFRIIFDVHRMHPRKSLIDRSPRQNVAGPKIGQKKTVRPYQILSSGRGVRDLLPRSAIHALT